MQDTIELTHGEFWAMIIPAVILYAVVLMDLAIILPITYRTLRMKVKQYRYNHKRKRRHQR